MVDTSMYRYTWRERNIFAMWNYIKGRLIKPKLTVIWKEMGIRIFLGENPGVLSIKASIPKKLFKTKIYEDDQIPIICDPPKWMFKINLKNKQLTNRFQQ